MNIFIFGKNAKKIEGLVKSFGFVISKKAEVIISLGGDGTLLSSERHFPGTPKLPIRDSENCIKCPKHQEEIILEKLKNNELNLTKHQKLKAEFKKNTLVALNDIVIRNALPTDAIRFLVSLNGKLLVDDQFIGDGVVASTPFGSSGYFKSITQRIFSQNFQMALNNPTTPHKPLEFKDGDLIQIDIKRGPASLSSDNNPKIFKLNHSDCILIQPASAYAYIYSPENLSCLECRKV